MGAKRVTLDCFLTIGGTDRRANFNSWGMETMKAQVDSGVFGNAAEVYELGLFSGSLSAELRADADHVFLKYLVTHMNAADQVAVVWRGKNSAKATDNPELTFNIKIDKVPFGGARGALANSGTMQWKVDGPVTYDDTTTPIVLGG